MKTKNRVVVLMHEELVPPDTLKGLSATEIEKVATEYDVIQALESLGHEVHARGIGSDLGALRKIFDELKPDIVFNMLVHFHGVAVYDHHVVSYMELMRKAYTGCNPRGLLLARDKALSKKLLTYHRIRVPKFFLVPYGRKVRRPKRLPLPLLVKSVTEEASLGISQASVVTSDEQLAERVQFMHERFGVDVIAEQFVDGRELSIGVLGNDRLTTFPVWELLLEGLPEGAYRIATDRVKSDLKYQEKYKLDLRRAEGLSVEQQRHIASLARRVYRVLGLSGYARIDLRFTADGQAYVLEANPNPELKRYDDFAEGAEGAGLSYEALIQRILGLGLAYQAEWRKLAD